MAVGKSLMGQEAISEAFSKPFERAHLVSAHEATVAIDIRCEDCDKASADCHRV